MLTAAGWRPLQGRGGEAVGAHLPGSSLISFGSPNQLVALLLEPSDLVTTGWCGQEGAPVVSNLSAGRSWEGP